MNLFVTGEADKIRCEDIPMQAETPANTSLKFESLYQAKRIKSYVKTTSKLSHFSGLQQAIKLTDAQKKKFAGKTMN